MPERLKSFILSQNRFLILNSKYIYFFKWSPLRFAFSPISLLVGDSCMSDCVKNLMKVKVYHIYHFFCVHRPMTPLKKEIRLV